VDTLKRLRIGTGIAAAPRAGEVTSGDLSMVLLTPEGALVGVVDGLGHGEEAAACAKLAVSILESCRSESIMSLVRRCHEELRGTRGVVLSLASIDAVEGVMTWLGVGNVEGVLLRADPRTRPPIEWLLLRGGVVGGELPPLSGAVVSIFPGDTLILATDGIESGFAVGLTPRTAPQLLANRILRRHAKKTDDALVLVARYLESPA
jgi:serine phosphatase RsbU (regulator of sigma subunit)